METVYFSLAKRRKIKGKQETTARDSGNQTGLRPGMDFHPGRTNAGHRTVGWFDQLIVVQKCGIPHRFDFPAFVKWDRLKNIELKDRNGASCHLLQSLTSGKKRRTAPGLAETTGGADVGIEGAESAGKTDLPPSESTEEKRFPRGLFRLCLAEARSSSGGAIYEGGLKSPCKVSERWHH
ncbi:hypothetical protein EAG_11952 [Camponotus floridanus]|uniref:Uncharacterized protein n=1 Tax=Camponotus floridanus TaxID=104421 RepID=E2AW75_CAMFO|nr:hypothetical protein EAG_11952 [Camponotus floridanus]